MVLCKTRSKSTVTVFFWLFLCSQSYRQEDEVESLLMDVDAQEQKAADALAGKVAVAQEQKAADAVAGQVAVADEQKVALAGQVATAANKTQPNEWQLDLFCLSIGDSTGVGLAGQLVLGAKCPLGAAAVGVSATEGQLTAVCQAGVSVTCQLKGVNLADLLTKCNCVGELASCSFLQPAIDAAIKYTATKYPQVRHIFLDSNTGYEISVKVTASVPGLSVGGKLVAAPGMTDNEGFENWGGGASASLGLEVEVIIVAGYREEDNGFKIAVGFKAGTGITVQFKMVPIASPIPCASACAANGG